VPQTLHVTQPANGSLVVESQINEAHVRIYKPGRETSTPAGQGGGRAGLDRLIVLPARLAEVDVHVDQPGGHDLVGGVEDRLAPLGRHVVAGDAAAVDQEVGHAVHLLAGINHATVLDQELRHGGGRQSYE